MDDSLRIYQEPPSSFMPSTQAAACYCLFGDKILLLKRNPNRPLGNTWGVPGGKIETGESANQAAAREVFEEVGIRLTEYELEELPKIYVRRKGADVVLYRFRKIFKTLPHITLNLDEHSEALWISVPDALALPNRTGAVMGLKLL